MLYKLTLAPRGWFAIEASLPQAGATGTLPTGSAGRCVDRGGCGFTKRRPTIATWEGWAYLGHRHRPSPPDALWAGCSGTTCAPSSSSTPSTWPSSAGTGRRCDLPLRPPGQYTSADTPTPLEPTAWRCQSDARASAGTMRSPGVPSRPSSASSPTPAPGPPAPGRAPQSSNTSRLVNTRRLHSSLGYLSPADYEAKIHRNADRQAA